MSIDLQSLAPSKPALWVGRILAALSVLFLLFDAGAKIAQVDEVMKVCAEMGIPARIVPGLGITLLVSTIIFVIPATAPLGAILITGYLGGAVWTHVQRGDPIFPIVFPVIFGAMVWGSLYFRDPRVRQLLPFRRPALAPRAVEEPAQAVA
ncbi:DoxX family protein [Singulisphaera sp. PoT]|uniref:DoxX family protein n=1 Tax=Singulisphaera sp. PoT TaxID=3411797 RepID=UPI003BF46631